MPRLMVESLADYSIEVSQCLFPLDFDVTPESASMLECHFESVNLILLFRRELLLNGYQFFGCTEQFKKVVLLGIGNRNIPWLN